MRQSLVPVLLLAVVAVSSSNVLSMLALENLNSEQLPLHSQHNDNTYSNRFHTRNLLNELILKSKVYNKVPKLRRATDLKYYDSDNNNVYENSNLFNKIDQYNVQGYRQEQWHNYPRQLDRLHSYLNESPNPDKRNLDPDDNGNEYFYDNQPENQDSNNNDYTNEFFKDTDTEDAHDFNGINTSPLFIFKIRLARLNNKLGDLERTNNMIPSGLEYINAERKMEDDRMMKNEINPADNVMIKVKREGEFTREDKSADDNVFGGKTVRKRIFSLWSRLKSLNHKGHELQHRRHLHAFYGMPDSDGGGVLTAETRAMFMRPPGSPLRWG